MLVARELMEAEISGRDRAVGGRARDADHASQWVSAAAVGDAGRGDRAADPEDAPRAAISRRFWSRAGVRSRRSSRSCSRRM